jgi:hypothetical protein
MGRLPRSCLLCVREACAVAQVFAAASFTNIYQNVTFMRVWSWRAGAPECWARLCSTPCMLAVMLLLMSGLGALLRVGPSFTCVCSSLPGAALAHAAHAGGSVPAHKASWACCPKRAQIWRAGRAKAPGVAAAHAAHARVRIGVDWEGRAARAQAEPTVLAQLWRTLGCRLG